MTTPDFRLLGLTIWASAQARHLNAIDRADIPLQVVSGDASFRRYYRLVTAHRTFIAVDAPPAHENSRNFVQIAELLRSAGVSAPQVFAVDYEQGFMLLEDFGDTLYLQPLRQAQARHDSVLPERLYSEALRALVTLQFGVDAGQLPAYDDARLHAEMALFETWFCEAFLDLTLSAVERERIADAFRFLAQAALSQPQVAVHRDYHSRNLLVLDAANFSEGTSPGIIDFQDAVAGAYTYDLVSLLRDCYISWEPAQIRHWALSFRALAAERGMYCAISESQFVRDFDLMGLQRNLKVMGIFSRLSIRDNKPRYLADIPLVIRYFLVVSEQYEELVSFRRWFTQTVLPVAHARLDLI